MLRCVYWFKLCGHWRSCAASSDATCAVKVITSHHVSHVSTVPNTPRSSLSIKTSTRIVLYTGVSSRFRYAHNTVHTHKTHGGDATFLRSALFRRRAPRTPDDYGITIGTLSGLIYEWRQVGGSSVLATRLLG